MNGPFSIAILNYQRVLVLTVYSCLVHKYFAQALYAKAKAIYAEKAIYIFSATPGCRWM